MSEPIRDLYVGKHLALRAVGTWEFAERPKVTGCVVIFARTEDNEVILVEQFRPAVNRRVIALAAGLAGDLAGAEKEGLAAAARREFEEETAYRATSMKFMIQGPSSSGLTSEIMSFFHAEGVQKIEGQVPDADEGIICHLVPMKELIAWLQAREDEGCLIDYKIYTALYLADLAP